MPKLIFSLVLLLALSSFQLAYSQDDERPEFKMPCAEVVKLGLEKFTDVYGEKTQDYSTYGMKQGLAYYAECKRPANDARVSSLTEAERTQVNSVRDELQKLGNATWDMAYISAGGGTMYGLASVSAYADREDFMASVISALSQPRRSQPAARRRANAQLARARRLLVRWSRVPKMESYSWDSPQAIRNQYRTSFKEAREAVDKLTLLVRDLPDVAAERVAKRTADEMDAALEI
jgi:hypothetical protein